MINKKNINIKNNIFEEKNLILIKSDIITFNNSRNKSRKKYIVNFIFISLFFISYFLFYLSLEKCYEGWDECCIKLKLVEAILSVLILSILIEFILLKIISKINFIHIICIYLFFYYYSHGKDFDDHGYYNLIGCFLILIFIFIGLIPFNLFICIQKKRQCSPSYILFLFLIIIIYYMNYIFNKKFMTCDDWILGLNNSFIDNNKTKYGCMISVTKICPYKIGKYFMDITKIKGIQCKNRYKNIYNRFMQLYKSPYINNNTKRIGYPIINKENIYRLDYKENLKILYNYFLNNLIDMDNKDLINNLSLANLPEIEIDFSNNTHGIMNINLNFNEKLSKERKKKEKYVNSYSNNLMILYIDSVSRANSLRQLKKTLNFFEKFMSFKGGYNKHFPSENYHSFQFFKYHSFLYHTRGNYPILFYGNTRYNNNTLITKFLKKNGFITCYCNDFCMKDNVRTFHNMTLSEVYDHVFIICDPNVDHYNQHTTKCLYGKNNADHLYEYGNQFWRKYNNNRKFLNIIINDGHEGTLEALKYVDDIIFNFLNNLYNENYFKDSSIFLLSDHGVGMPSVYSFYKFYNLEAQLPMLYIILNDRKNIKYKQQYKYIYENQQTLITAYDIYNTFINIIYGDKYFLLKNKLFNSHYPKSNLGISLLNKINQTLRHPRLYENMSRSICY